MMTCKELTELVTEYLEGEMRFMERLSFRMHIAMCRSCRTYVRQLKQTVEVLGGLPDDFEIPDEVRDELLEVFRDWKSQSPSTKMS